MADIVQINSTTFGIAAKADPRDKIDVEIGDSKQTDFYPQVKIMRWDNEVNLSVRLVTDETVKVASLAADKVQWEGSKVSAEYCELTDNVGGIEFEVILKEKPDSNKLIFSVQSKGLVATRQLPLTEDPLALAVCDYVTETEGFKNGVRIIYCPENIIGSYSIRYQNHPINREGGKLYRIGKAVHLYRSKSTDADGNQTWNELDLDLVNGYLAIEIPQKFLDDAVYPVVVDPAFGAGSAPANSFSGSYKTAGYFQAPEAGTLSSITFWYILSGGSGSDNVNFGYYIGTSSSITTHQAHGSPTSCSVTTKAEMSINVSGEIAASTYYWLLQHQLVAAAAWDIYYESSSGNNMAYGLSNGYDDWPANPTGTFLANYIMGCYATYTAGGGGRTALNTRSNPLGIEIGMGWRMPL